MQGLKKELFREIIALVFENKEAFKEGDYISINEKLMKLYNEVQRDLAVERGTIILEHYGGVEDHFEPINDFISDAIEYIIDKVYERYNDDYSDFNDFRGADIDFCSTTRYDFGDPEEYYDVLKTIIIPILCSRGFDCRMFYYEENDFTKSNFDGSIVVSWSSENDVSWQSKIETFNKKTPYYYFDRP